MNQKTKEEKIAIIQARITCANIELEGMKASNKQREILGDSIGYNEVDFYNLMSNRKIDEENILKLLDNEN